MFPHPVLQQQAAGVAAADAAATPEGHDPPVETEAIGAGRWCGKIVWLVGVWLMSWRTESRRENKRINNALKKTRR